MRRAAVVAITALLGTASVVAVAAPVSAGEGSEQRCTGHIRNETRGRAKVVAVDLGPGDHIRGPDPRGRVIEPDDQLQYDVIDGQPSCRVDVKLEVDRDGKLIGRVELGMRFSHERGSASCAASGDRVVCAWTAHEVAPRHLAAVYTLKGGFPAESET